MTIILILLAIPGALAVLLRLGTALLHAGKYSLERYVARQIFDQRATRGDLSGMAEAEKVRVTAANKQMRFLGECAVWAALLGAPLLFPAAVVLYPIYSIFWFVPRRSKQVVAS
jgi:hypothetical protein